MIDDFVRVTPAADTEGTKGSLLARSDQEQF
jgi:hypothetical protein